MTRIVAIDEDQIELEFDPLPELALTLIDTDGQRHALTLEVAALATLASVLRRLEERFPGALTAH